MQDNRQKHILVNFTGRTKAGPVFAYEMTKGLVENGAVVYAVVSAQADNIADWRKLPLAKLIEITTYENRKEFLLRSIWFLFSRKKIGKELERLPIDAIYCPMVTLWTRWINRLFPHVPLYFTLHDPKPHYGESCLNRALIRYNTEAEAIRAEKIIVLSEVFVDEVRQRYHRSDKSILVVPHGVFDYQSRKSSHIEPFFATSSVRTTFLFFGRIEPYKGLDLLIEAYRAIETNVANTQLIIAGEGDISPYRKQLGILDSVFVLNRKIEDTEVSLLFCGENIITVLPYKEATQSGVVNIAASHRSLVIATESGGLPEQLGYGEKGLLIPPNNVAALHQAMLDVIKHRDEYERKIECAYNDSINFTWKALAGKILEEIQG